MSKTILYPNQIVKETNLYTLFNPIVYPYAVWFKRTFRGSRVICRSTVTGRFLNHSIVKVALTYHISNKFRFEIYN